MSIFFLSSFFSEAPSPAQAAPVTIKRSATIGNIRAKLSDVLENADANQAGFTELYNELHQKWWQQARQLSNTGGHHSLRGHVLDWPLFFPDLTLQQHIENLLHIVFQKVSTATTRKHGPKLARERPEGLRHV